MIRTPAPKIEPRIASDVVAQLYKRGVPASGLSASLAGLFGRLSEIVIDRLNRAPEKNMLAFLDLLGASLLPPQPARVPLTFFLAAGAAREAVVPAGTQAAAPPGPGEQDPVIYETERELIVSPARLTTAFVRDARRDRFADASALLNPAIERATAAFQGTDSIEHSFFIGKEELSYLQGVSGVTMYFTFADIPPAEEWHLSWEVWDGKNGIPISGIGGSGHEGDPILNTDTASGLLHAVTFNFPPPIPRTTVRGLENHWLRVRLKTPLTESTAAQPGMVRASQIPRIDKIEMTVHALNSGPLDAAFFNHTALDLTKDFLPFGERPAPGDAFYMASPLFRHKDADVQIIFGQTERYTAYAAGGAKVAWEFWDGKQWVLIGAVQTNVLTSPPNPNLDDTTQAFSFSMSHRSGLSAGTVRLILPAEGAPLTLNGVTSYWLRARLIAGNYGELAKYNPDRSVAPATLMPPSIHFASLQSKIDKYNVAPDAVVVRNDFAEEIATAPFVPFRPSSGTTLNLGFDAGLNGVFPRKKTTVYISTVASRVGSAPDNAAAQAEPRVDWEYWNGTWAKLAVRDETRALTTTGLVEFIPPDDFLPVSQFGAEKYWLRANWTAGDYRYEPALRHAFLNTTTATQAITLRNEILGSASGDKGFTAATARRPVLPGQALQVREADLPSAEDRAAIEREEGPDSVSAEATGVWVRWHEVPDFHASDPRDRHYVIDHIQGRIRFGDGRYGRVPASGSNNIRMASYRTGGGERGNRPARVIVQLKTTVPYIDRIINPEEAAGGAEAENIDSLVERTPRALRHSGRAVTGRDFEDLARLASPEVARAQCVPLRNLDTGDPTPAPGLVGLIVVPHSSDPMPTPGVRLIETVRRYLVEHSIETLDLRVTGAPFVRIDVDLQIGLASLDGSSEIELAAAEALAKFLHPLTGGADGEGWDFGRRPQKSDIIALLSRIPGIDHIPSITINATLPPGALNADLSLVYSGRHHISLVQEED